MNKYHYDQVYPYEVILQEVKELIMPTIVERVNPEDVETFILRKEDIANMLYSQIMALGYNAGDINAAVNDNKP